MIEIASPLGLIVSRPAPAVDGRDTLSRAGQVMESSRVSAVLVDRGEAILSERDMTRALVAGRRADDPVSSVATPHPLAVSSHTAILDAAALMLNEEVRHLVVRFDDDDLGIVSMRAVLAVLLQASTPEMWMQHLRLEIRLHPSDLWLG